ncbi:glycosyltransferase family 39 protein [Gordonia sp. NPDC003504]
MTGRRWLLGASLAVGLLGVVLSAAGSWRPSFWYDEAATVSAIDRSYPQLLSLVHHTDGVHAAYYMVTKAWASVFGISEFSLRFPSAMAIGGASALLVVLGNRLWSTWFGVLAALALLTVPRITWAGMEARSYAGTVFLSIALCLVLLYALDRGRWWWVAYGFVAGIAGIWFLLSLTLVVAHLMYVLLTKRSAWPWLFATAVGVAIVLSPFVWWVSGQRAQIDWIPDTTDRTVAVYALWEFFDGSWPFAVTALLVVVVGVVASMMSWTHEGHRVLVLSLCWLVVPAGLVWLISVIGEPLYTPRYLAFTTPGVALLLAWSAMHIARESRWISLLVVLIPAVAAAPGYVAGRGTYGHMGGSDFSAVADYIGEHAQPGDCVAFDSAPSWSPVSQRVVMSARPADFVGLRDLGPAVDAARAGRLWDVDQPVTAYRAFAESCEVMWVITDGERDVPFVELPGGTLNWYFEPFHFTGTPLYRELSQAGLHITDRTEFCHSQVVRMQSSG